MSMDGDMVTLHSSSVYLPVSKKRVRMSLEFEAITSLGCVHEKSFLKKYLGRSVRREHEQLFLRIVLNLNASTAAEMPTISNSLDTQK